MKTRNPVLLASLLVLLASFSDGCGFVGNGIESGNVAICYDVPKAVEENQQSNELNATFDGEVVYARNVEEVPEDVDMDCGPTRVLKVNDDGQEWRIGYKVQGADGGESDVTPSVGLEKGEKVEVALTRVQPWGTSRAFSVKQNGGLVLALDDGYSAQLTPEALDGLEVKQGEAYNATERDGCGKKRARELVFKGKSRTSLRNGETGDVELSTGTVRAMNVAAYEFEKLNCTDMSAPNAWAVWRNN